VADALPQGAYTTLRAYGGRRVLRLDQHIERLRESVRLQGTPAALERSTVHAALAAALQATGLPESRLRLTFAPPRLFVSVEPFAPLGEALYRDGVACVLVPVRRTNPRAKDTGFIPTADEAYRALPPGAHEGLMRGEDGAILEGLSSNFFAVLKAELRTEGERALPGVTRALVLEVAQGVLPVTLLPVSVDQLHEVEECFITSVSREILPVVRIEGRPIAGGRPGQVTRGLRARWATLVEREAEALF
jgi:branched-subunit amino acid aminotransferase/4-amino-4-deoxychorismate lyase